MLKRDLSNEDAPTTLKLGAGNSIPLGDAP